MNNKVAQIYNTLFRAERLRRKEETPRPYPVHKKIQFAEQSIEDISHWLQSNVRISENAHILDAGCGVGFTLITLCQQSSYTGLGISLSNREITYARKVSQALQLNERCQFMEHSFDQPLDDAFDLIIAIESIKHAGTMEVAVSNLLKHLKPNGQMVIIDDFATGTAPRFITKPIQLYWSVPRFFQLQDVVDCVHHAEDYRHEVIDFTNEIAFRNRVLLIPKMMMALIINTVLKLFKKHNAVGIFYAGLCLEWLYKKGMMEYKAVVIKKTTK